MHQVTQGEIKSSQIEREPLYAERSDFRAQGARRSLCSVQCGSRSTWDDFISPGASVVEIAGGESDRDAFVQIGKHSSTERKPCPSYMLPGSKQPSNKMFGNAFYDV